MGSTSVSSTKFIHRSKRVLQLPIDIGNFAVNLRSFFKLSSGRREDYSHLQDVTEVTAHYVLVILLSAGSPVDIRTINARTKDVHERTFIFGSFWKHGKTSESERSDEVRLKDVVFMSLIFFLAHSLENKNQKYKYQSIWNWQSRLTQMN